MTRTRLNPGQTGTFFLDNEEEITIIAIEDDMENVPQGGYCPKCVLRNHHVCMTMACSAKEDRVGVHFIKK